MDIRKLQRAIVDGLEDVKAQNIVVFNTEHLSPLFERVVIASGTSNRQTKALASSVRDAVKGRGMQVLRTEGEDNGEWIIVDCGAAVVHVMQPAIRDYYHLEEIWGGKAVKLKMEAAGAPKLVKASEDAGAAPRRRSAKADADLAPAPAKKAGGKKAPAKKAVPAEEPAPARKRAPARKAAATSAAPRKAPAKKAVTRTVGVKRPAATKAPTKAAPRKAPAKKTAKKA
jgi:ribosome-associated protein